MKTGLKWGKVGRPSKAAIAERLGMIQQTPVPTTGAIVTSSRTDEELLAEIEERFRLLGRYTESVCDGKMRAVLVCGAPGVGKSFMVHQILRQREVRHTIVGGDISPIGLYMLAYEYRNKGDVMLFDDCDNIFAQEQSANLLKHLCDSSEFRRLSWIKDSPTLRDANIPTSFDFEGSVMFISNLNINQLADSGRSMSAHLDALRDRAVYVDLRLHERRQILVWVRHVAKKTGMLEREGVPPEIGERIFQFMEQNLDSLLRISFRTIGKACQIYHSVGESEFEAGLRTSLCVTK